jgi:hypothetical protein
MTKQRPPQQPLDLPPDLPSLNKVNYLPLVLA